ncbi:MAG: HIT family protein [Sphingobacteriaceae bacterium]|nr:HIT family protein [Sphingobacteriaceae bacterium]
MPTIFSRIISGEIPCHKIAEDDRFLAFLDIQPLVEGHVLVIPKVEVDYIFHLEDDLLAGLMVFSKRIAPAIEKAIPCKRLGVTVIGLEVPHTHVHLIPIQEVGDMNFSKRKLNPSYDDLADVAKRITANL